MAGACSGSVRAVDWCAAHARSGVDTVVVASVGDVSSDVNLHLQQLMTLVVTHVVSSSVSGHRTPRPCPPYFYASTTCLLARAQPDPAYFILSPEAVKEKQAALEALVAPHVERLKHQKVLAGSIGCDLSVQRRYCADQVTITGPNVCVS